MSSLLKFKITLIFFLSSSLFVFAGEPVKNGDFKDGRNFWSGEGKVINVDEAGQTVTKDGFPALDLTASKSSFVNCEQSIKLNQGVTKVVITVIAKQLPDFRPNKESTKFTKNFGPGWWKWSGVIAPKADFCIRLQDGWYYYRAMNFPAGDDWQTIVFNIDGLNPQGYKKLMLILSPGEGNILVRSVTLKENPQ
ncbi:MAG: hypothetical protein ABI443_10870 [Chthoniobacterales bacterium]